MIIFRYLSKEIFTVLTAVTLILLLVFLSNQFARYLSYAADGRILSSLLFKLMLLEVPQLIGLLLPLGLFLGILLAFGRLYVDGELTVLTACGFSRCNLIVNTMAIAIAVTAIVSIITFYISPHLLSSKGRILSQASSSLLASVLPGRFQASADGRKVFYIERMSRDRQKVRNVFVAERIKSSQEQPASGSEWSVFSAKSGYQHLDKQTNNEFIVATDGYRYQGIPGQLDFSILKYRKYGLRLDDRPIAISKEKKALTTSTLWQQVKQHDVTAIAELQWRLAIPLSALLLALLAVPMSYVRPRQGKYAQLLPAILIYIIYANLLFVGRAWVSEGVVNPTLGMWWVHGCLLILILFLLPTSATWRRSFSLFKRANKVNV